MLFHIEFHNSLDDGKEPAVRLIDNIHADIEAILPLEWLHILPFFAAARRIYGG